MGFFSSSSSGPRVGHKISGQLATQALSRNLDPHSAGKSFSGHLSSRAFDALKKDPEIAKHLSGVRKGFKSEVPEEIVHRAQEKLAQEKLIRYGARKDSYKLGKDLSKDLRKAESMSGHDKKDALKFLKLGEEEYQTQLRDSQNAEIDPAKIKKEIRKKQAQIAFFGRLPGQNRVEKLKNEILGLEIKMSPEKEKTLRYNYTKERLSELPVSNPQNDLDNKEVKPTLPSPPPDIFGSI